MTDEPTSDRVRQLRARGLSPKEIARNLGIRPAEASNLVRKLAAEHNPIDGDAERVECLLNAGWSNGLRINGHPEWHDSGNDENAGGLVTALVARRRRHRRGATVCVYLLDVWCLGVKNAMGPRTIDEQALRQRTDQFFSGYHSPPIAAPIELVRDLVLGAAEYARQLGFAPHPDFEQAHAHTSAHEPAPAPSPSATTANQTTSPAPTITPIGSFTPYDAPSAATASTTQSASTSATCRSPADIHRSVTPRRRPPE